MEDELNGRTKSDDEDQDRLLEAAETLRSYGWNPGRLLSLMAFMECRATGSQPKTRFLRSVILGVFAPSVLLEIASDRSDVARVLLTSDEDPEKAKSDGKEARSVLLTAAPVGVPSALRRITKPPLGRRFATAKKRLEGFAEAIRSVRPPRSESPEAVIVRAVECLVAYRREKGDSSKMAWGFAARAFQWESIKDDEQTGRASNRGSGQGDALRKWVKRKRGRALEASTPAAASADESSSRNVKWWLSQLRRDVESHIVAPGMDNGGGAYLSHGSQFHAAPARSRTAAEQERRRSTQRTGGTKSDHLSDHERGRGSAPGRTPDASPVALPRDRPEVREAEPRQVPVRRGGSRGVHAGKNLLLDRGGDRQPRDRRGGRVRKPP